MDADHPALLRTDVIRDDLDPTGEAVFVPQALEDPLRGVPLLLQPAFVPSPSIRSMIGMDGCAFRKPYPPILMMQTVQVWMRFSEGHCHVWTPPVLQGRN